MNDRTAPLGLKILAGLMAIGGILVILSGILMFFLTSQPLPLMFSQMSQLPLSPSVLYILAVFYTLLGIFELVLAWNLWKLKKWACYATIGLQSIGIVLGLAGGLGGILSLAIPVIIVWYLWSNRGIFESVEEYEFVEYESVTEKYPPASPSENDERAVEPLLTALRNEHWNARANAVKALGKVCDKRAVEPLLAALQDEYSDVRAGAADALGKIGDMRAIPALEKTASDSVESVRNRATKALDKIKSSAVYKKRLEEEALEKAHNEASDFIRSTESEIAELKSSGVKIPEAEGLLEQAKAELDNNVEQVKELAEEAKKIANERKAEYDSAVESIFEAETVINEVRTVGVAISDELLTKSKQVFDEGDYEGAVESAKEAEGIAKRIREQNKPEITLTLPKETFQPNQWKKTEITIRNTGATPAKNIRVEPSGDFEFRDIPAIPQLNTDETETITIAMKPTAVGDVPIDVAVTYRDALDRDYKSPDAVWVVTVSEQAQSPEPRSSTEELAAIEIRRGYEVLPNNDLRFGIRVINPTAYVILDVQTILDYPKTLFSLKGDVIQTLANIPPNGERTAKYVLTPLGCVHQEKIDAIVRYDDHAGEKHTVQMLPKEVHCVCPFLREKAIREGEFANLAAESAHLDEGVSFSGIGVGEIVKLIRESCVHRLYVIGEHEHDGRVILYFAGESIGGKTYYLLTTVVGAYKGVTQVALRAYSDKTHGLHGFLNEMTGSLRQLVGSVQSAKEIGIIEEKQVVNIIDSVVQRTSFGGAGQGANTEVNIEGSVVHRSDVGNRDRDSREAI